MCTFNSDATWCAKFVNFTQCLLTRMAAQIKAFSDLLSRLASGDTSLLAETHATTSGLKVLVTTTAIHDLETCRRSMGDQSSVDSTGRWPSSASRRSRPEPSLPTSFTRPMISETVASSSICSSTNQLSKGRESKSASASASR